MPDQPVERKLAAIFAADIAGYSRLMAHDEIGTLARLKACRTIIDGLITAHRGRISSSRSYAAAASSCRPELLNTQAQRSAISSRSGRNSKATRAHSAACSLLRADAAATQGRPFAALYDSRSQPSTRRKKNAQRL